jgi:hypothetical protein
VAGFEVGLGFAVGAGVAGTAVGVVGRRSPWVGLAVVDAVPSVGAGVAGAADAVGSFEVVGSVDGAAAAMPPA